MKRIFIILFIISINIANAQTWLPEKDVFAFFMKIYNHKPLDNTNNRSINFGQFRWFDLYLLKFYGYEYNQVVNDEFKVQNFLKKVNNEFRSKIKKVNYNKIYIKKIEATFGKYDFSKGGFPIHYKMEKFKGAHGFEGGFRINIENIINEGSFDAILKMNRTDAENFINNRKMQNGYVDRKIYLKFYFKITPINNLIKSPRGGVNGYDKNDLTIEVTSIDIFGNEITNNSFQTIEVKRNNNSTVKNKIVGKWKKYNSNYEMEYKTDNTLIVKLKNENRFKGKYYFINDILIETDQKGIYHAYKIKIEGNKLYAALFNKFGEWKRMKSWYNRVY